MVDELPRQGSYIEDWNLASQRAEHETDVRVQRQALIAADTSDSIGQCQRINASGGRNARCQAEIGTACIRHGCLAGDGSLSHHQRGRITSGQDRLGAERFGEGRSIEADSVHKAQSRRRVLVIDDDEGTPQRHPSLVLDARMLLQEIGEELFFSQIADAPHKFVVNRFDGIELA